ncbi:hypothetical protein GCM10022402_45360 [Salinactinospora qingdaonensis]|uniref:Uncharacterized protein n=1 Tax=Salinactinospora qingdaonensis TaxID=702744 RepID=A0ABP7GDA6_9ACTN
MLKPLQAQQFPARLLAPRGRVPEGSPLPGTPGKISSREHPSLVFFPDRFPEGSFLAAEIVSMGATGSRQIPKSLPGC